MSKPDEVSPRPELGPIGAQGHWTRLEDYLDLARLWRRSAERRRRRLRPRTELSEPRLLSIGTLPFALLMAAMALLAFLIIIAAVPGKRAPAPPPEPAPVGTAPPGWFEG